MSILIYLENRVQEVELYFEFAAQINKVESHKTNNFQLTPEVNLDIKRDVQKIIRANCYLLLYNLIESTIRSCIWGVYDAISDDNLTFIDLSDNLRNIWLTQQALEFREHGNNKKTKEKIDNLITSSLDKKTIDFLRTRISISGNLDYQNIEKIIKEYGFYGRINIVDKRKLVKAFSKVKSERNALAHGNKSFRQTAEIITIQDLSEFKDLIANYLRDIVKNADKFIDEKSYKK
ncbi:MAE_28990/MAE_18760 family HEPN-like nuclease [Pedobacter ureilyticus]|uniref:MAE_28990/MAE_18760 family HEPN-like nuclease n=1 Tax=Pedobacter ureilyticus TaxID=1393051 RepID=A0ABW9JCY7_9SPHI|nr:MAE_28990/MAE_18760 family HEPN-like nuclease [Pedobacter helvus]